MPVEPEKLTISITSRSVESILGTIAQADESLRFAQDELDYCDKKTQDLLHEIELCELAYHEYAKKSKELKAIRRRRRVAKDIIDTVLPLKEWMDCNKVPLNQLRQCLGAMRKVEEKAKNRIYCRRIDDSDEKFIAVKERNMAEKK